MSDGVDIRPAMPSDFNAVESWLVSAGLPSADITPEHLNDFLVATLDDALIGVIGLEQTDSVGLLRSLVVDPSVRGGGIGKQLVERLESMAKERGISKLWLLTIDADGYFMKLRYDRRERIEAPIDIQNTAEFSGLCPGDAVLMCKML